jgi:hypothetical protein
VQVGERAKNRCCRDGAARATGYVADGLSSVGRLAARQSRATSLVALTTGWARAR